MSSASDAALTDLAAQVQSNTNAEASAVILLNGIAARIDAAVAKAIADNPGITAEQLAGITSETTSLKSAGDALAAAVVANTPVLFNPALPGPGYNPANPAAGTNPPGYNPVTGVTTNPVTGATTDPVTGVTTPAFYPPAA